jgi:spore coat protein I
MLDRNCLLTYLGGIFLEEKIRELLACYHLEIKRLYRGRGAWLCDTERGLKLFREYHGAPEHLQWEMLVKSCLRERGYIYIDQFVPNKEGSLLTTDEDGKNYVLSDWYEGRECSTRDKEEMLRAIAHMAWMHKGMQDISREKAIYETFARENFLDETGRRRRELKRIRNYIQRKKQKNDFDRRFTEVYQEFDEAAEEAGSILEEAGYRSLYKENTAEQRLCHGDYTQHNILMMHHDIALVRFDQMHMELQVYDLYVFMRKMLEKNHWNVGLGLAMLRTYQRVHPMKESHLRCLYGMMVFPEKFWKIANRYQNSRKSWMSAQNMDKLNKLIREKKERQIFLEEMERELKI